ncbi:MAG: hypothetical protein FJ108_06325 [Deltaproteobacteria bacterium]|nr:hypothetical protein [Deltaproteobacteria bacterium]
MNASVDDAREFVAETRDEALAKAASFFRVAPDQIDFWVVPATVTVSGLGSNVLVIAAPLSARPVAREQRRSEERPQQRSERPERRDERRDERTARSERPERPRREERPRSERPAPPPPAPRAAPEPEETEEDLEEGDLGPVGEFVAGILERMKLRGIGLTETETEEGDIIITLDGKAITALNDREPRFAAAISHLAHRAAEVLVDEEVAARVDIRGARRAASEERDERPRRNGRREEGRRERSDSRRDSDDRSGIDEAALERMAREAAEIVRRSGEPELLRPMNSRERWVVHNTLKDERGVRSESEGEGPRKRVRITPD